MAAHYTDELDSVRCILGRGRQDPSQFWAEDGRILHSGETRGKPGLSTFGRVDVVMLRWPAEQARRTELQLQGCPRLLLVEDGVPPVPVDDLEDWIRVPAGEVDLRVRVDGLRHRVESRLRPVPELDGDGVLRLDGLWVSLPPVEARLTAALLDRYGAVVSRDNLAHAGWPEGSPGRNALDVQAWRTAGWTYRALGRP